ncbi:MAG: hypothetical protein IPJ65_27140 [Archangiaceae bacterium]|nr:hypothetical protein [Archangiaceae bacterium]
MSPRLLVVLLLSACWQPVREPDCLLDKTCECKSNTQCLEGFECVDGFCKKRPDLNPGDLGWPCTQDSECNARICLPPGPGNGHVCSQPCNTADAGVACPRGYECLKAYDRAGFVCTPPLRSLCLGCTTDQDCNAAGDRCVELDGGKHCLMDCAISPCPDGYECRALGLLGDAGAVARVCTPPSSSCDCSPVNVGLARSCKRTNAMATCFGFERCLADGGFSGCDARTASPEKCNGVDDDCDGLIDDDDPDEDVSGLAGYPACTRGAVCKGAWYCGVPLDAGVDAGIAFQCSAPPIVAERCNGLDDDCDGLADEDFKDSAGVFSGPKACGSCALDCTAAVPDLARADAGLDAGPGEVLPGAVDCVQSAGAFRCVPRQCAPGHYPWPPAQPQVCLENVGSQCRPCTADEDCQVPGDTCTQLAQDVGRYCLQSCAGAACPRGSVCQTLGGKQLCQPVTESCSCTPDRVGFTRSCLRTSGAAVCIGAQVCRADGGFDACDTSLTALELCDGLDNDCDGTPDQPFVNQQGSGTYDTDAHCGACTTNCTAQWSPSIQHALGGCRLDAGSPSCRIVQCVNDVVGGGKLCQLDADCSGGETCHPLFRQCVKACTGASTGCAANEACQNGACGQRCSNDAVCTARYGALSHCSDAGTCAASYTFFDSDRESTNGCECPAPSGVTDAPDTYSAYPAAGQPYVDRDCDGVDGRVGRALYVWAQSSSSQGTRASPFKTLREAISAFNPAAHDAILVAQGSYPEQVVLKNGVKVYGGYASDFFKRDIVTFPTLIEAPQPDFAAANPTRGSVNAQDLSAETVLSGFTIRGYDVITRSAPGTEGFNSYAVYVADAPGLSLSNNVIVGGRAGDASPGGAGEAGATGLNGSRGLDARECTSASCAGESQTGGAAGANPSCFAANANAGAGSNPNVDPQNYTTGGLNGAGGNNGVYSQSAPSQAQFCKYDCIVPENGLNGLPALNGSDGTAGSRGVGCAAREGMLMGVEWRGGAGNGGSAGVAGRGGGGGGAGGCVSNSNPSTCTIGHLVGDLGATGGGGGAGGCGGIGGRGGTSGGGSFGVFISGARPTLFGNIIEPGFGGAGGPGGAGGYGGLGGAGGNGGVNNAVAWCAGLGGAGGRGGNGGAGAGGGGGCGGVSYGIAGAGIGMAFTTNNTLRAPPINAAGAGGKGGASPAGTGARGEDGVSGGTGTVRSF